MTDVGWLHGVQGFLQVDLSDDEIGMIVDTLVYDTLLDRVPQVCTRPIPDPDAGADALPNPTPSLRPNVGTPVK